ncbi:hypothetical protein B9Q02_10430 [Candidatus Marsarchaeota G1 archaeon BE_D]|uniref:Uncharacterized protein n=1 Tax=Candidatus Marsarchaeota G1 archaeon BE_D TaxID=1978156 RepID=A0A2R6AAV9_9ARCH|nr:MAG: hypothetical protein B9Q02_10430 [Candidatus Marsarchaeota G1 archaeon BE_D]
MRFFEHELWFTKRNCERKTKEKRCLHEWNRVVLPSLLGGCVETGGKRKGTSELVRFLNDALKPKLCYAYDRYADEYLRRAKPPNCVVQASTATKTQSGVPQRLTTTAMNTHEWSVQLLFNPSTLFEF